MVLGISFELAWALVMHGSLVGRACFHIAALHGGLGFLLVVTRMRISSADESCCGCADGNPFFGA